MLDLKTILVVTMAVACLQALSWIFVWRAWRHLYELRLLAAAFIAIALGVLFMLLRGHEPSGWEIVIHNTVLKLGLVLLAEGMARFLGQPGNARLSASLLVLHCVVWSLAVSIDPENIAVRICSSTIFTIIVMTMMCLALKRDRTQARLLRWITIAILLEYMAASVLQSFMELQLPANFESAPVLANRNAWYLLQGTLFLIALFACLLFMVNSRLSSDLREKNAFLQREVEERRRLEARLKASLETERSLRDEQADFMRVVSHEFRTPLAVIRNATEMLGLTGNRSPQATSERLSGINEALNRLFSLINRFLAEDGESGFLPEKIRIGSLLGDVQLHFEMTGRRDHLSFNVEVPDLIIHADPDMLATVLINLIDNGLKYSRRDEPVFISVTSDRRSVRFEIRDSGIGIPVSELKAIGRRFYRASNATSVVGTGLGLYTAYKLLAYHKGRLKIGRAQPQGTVASVELPLTGDRAKQALLPEELVE